MMSRDTIPQAEVVRDISRQAVELLHRPEFKRRVPCLAVDSGLYSLSQHLAVEVYDKNQELRHFVDELFLPKGESVRRFGGPGKDVIVDLNGLHRKQELFLRFYEGVDRLIEDGASYDTAVGLIDELVASELRRTYSSAEGDLPVELDAFRVGISGQYRIGHRLHFQAAADGPHDSSTSEGPA